MRRDRIARTAPTPTTIADPLNHSDKNVEYQGAVSPPGSQFTIGKNPNTEPATAQRIATQRQRDKESAGDSRLAKQPDLVEEDD